MLRFSLFIFTVLFILAAGCKKNPTPPDVRQPSPREYTWTVDTLWYSGPGAFQTLMFAIWGSAPDDIYAVGHNSNPRSDMYHYDGNQWIPVNILSDVIQGSPFFSDVYGFSSSDVWVVGDRGTTNPSPPPNLFLNSLIIHYDGSQWQSIDIPKYGSLTHVWGSAPDNIYAVGDSGLIFHFDGMEWKSEFLEPPAQLQFLSGDEDMLFAAGTMRQGGNDSLVAYVNDGTGWRKHDSQLLREEHRFGMSGFYSPQKGVYYSIGYGIFQWQNSSWKKVYSINTYLSDIAGTGVDNIITVGQLTSAYHWNGTDWAALNLPAEHYPAETWFTGVWMNETDVFICGIDLFKDQTYILHGKP